MNLINKMLFFKKTNFKYNVLECIFQHTIYQIKLTYYLFKSSHTCHFFIITIPFFSLVRTLIFSLPAQVVPSWVWVLCIINIWPDISTYERHNSPTPKEYENTKLPQYKEVKGFGMSTSKIQKWVRKNGTKEKAEQLD